MKSLVVVSAVGVSVSAVAVAAVLTKWHLSKGSSTPTLNDEADKKGASPVSNADWQWPIYDQYTDNFGQVELKKREAGAGEEGPDSGPFRVIYRREADLLWPDVVQIILSSRPLCEIISQHIPNDGDLKTLAEPTIDGRDLFIVLDALKSHKIRRGGHGGGGAVEQNGLPNGKGLANGAAAPDAIDADAAKETTEEEEEEGALHLKHLVKFLEKEYRDLPVRIRRMRTENRVAWDVLWAFLPVGTTAVYNCDHSQELLCAVVSALYYEFVPGQGWFLLLELDMWEFDGLIYKKCQVRRQIRKFEGERPFSTLAVCPIDLKGSPEALTERFLNNGKRYSELAMSSSHKFMHYRGALFQQRLAGNCFQLFKENADGRVMIDQASFAKMNPDYPMGNAQPPSASTYWVCRGNSSFEFCAPREMDGLAAGEGADSEVSSENLLFAPGIVYGFSFTLKQWGAFAIGGFRDITFDSGAFRELVMEPQQKGLVHNLVSQYLGPPDDGLEPVVRVDPISSKGEGCVFLCYGPPGTGKTLTAESIAETMSRPLWALSVSELGTTPNDLEKILSKVLDIAANWQAVLLLDEADVYLERRMAGADVTRNAMTGVFLRMLEYYRGVLFLTTNRIGTFDEAFRSRISMFLRYSTLSSQHKQMIWGALLEKASVGDVPSEKLGELAALDLNGREIRNAIHTAQTWARSNGETLGLQHVEYVMGVMETSLEALNEALHAPPQN